MKESDVNVLGKGSFGTVVTGIYKGKNISSLQRSILHVYIFRFLDEDVAVKVVRLNRNEELNETKAIRLNHENIIKTLDVIINSNMNYAIVVMERLNLSRHLQNILDDEDRSLEKESILKYALDISRGLNFCHENGLVHMDLKPANILVCEDDVCKLCDFGSCYDIEIDSGKDYVHRVSFHCVYLVVHWSI